MLVRPFLSLLAALSLLNLSAAASAQCAAGREAPLALARLVSRSVPGFNTQQHYVSTIIAPPTLETLAQAPYTQVRPEPDSCQTHRQPVRYAQRRATSSMKRSESHLPKPISSPEQLAAAKYQGAHLLWKAGKPEAARRWLESLVAHFPQTDAAVRAKNVLAKM